MKRVDFERAVVLEPMSFDSASGYPPEDRIYFECTLCGEIVGSHPAEATECACGNLRVDADSGTLDPRHSPASVLVLHARPRS